MKKIISKIGFIAFMFSSFSVINSCSSEDQDAAVIAAQNAAQVTAADGLAAYQAFVSVAGCASAGPLGSLGVTIFSGIMGGIASFNQASALGVLNRLNQTSNFLVTSTNEFPLPYVNESNPYECMGKIHNLILKKISQCPSNKRDQLINNLQFFDYETYNNLGLDGIECGVPETNPLALIEPACRNQLSVIPEPYKNSTTYQIYNSITTTGFTSSYISQKMLQIQSNNYLALSTNEKLQILKSEIDGILGNNSIPVMNKNEILSFLTVLKYSTFYWSN